MKALMFLAMALAAAPAMAAPPLDHKKPWFTREGAPMCATKADLAALRENMVMEMNHSLQERKPASCWIARDGRPVTEVDHDGTWVPDYLVRLGDGRLAWTISVGLRN